MMLEYEWHNPAAAAAAAMMLFGDGGYDGQEIPAMLEHFEDHGGEFFAPPAQQLNAAALFSTAPAPVNAAACGQMYGIGLPPALAPARIGLNLGVRTYFSSASPEGEMGLGRVCRRRTRTVRCQAERCEADLTQAKHYHRRHKVCEFHSKASIVIAAGLSQRFCQQCSRFHVLSEFDHGKRSCRKRLADHNRRRRKSQDLTAISIAQNNNNSTTTSVAGTVSGTAAAAAGVTILNNHPIKLELSPFESSTGSNMNNNNHRGSSKDGNPETASTITRHSSPAPAVPAMAIGLGCSGSGSSSTGTSPATVSFFSHLAEFRGHEHRFLNWDDGEDGSSVRSLYESKQ